VSNPLVELFKVVLLSDNSLLNKTIDEPTVAQITNGFELDSVDVSHLLGGIRLDKERKVGDKYLLTLIGPWSRHMISKMGSGICNSYLFCLT
jgi:hypothetical protein